MHKRFDTPLGGLGGRRVRPAGGAGPVGSGVRSAEKNVNPVIALSLKVGTNALSVGRNAHDVAPPGNWVPYLPEYAAVLYLGLVDGWKISVNHASYYVGTGGDRLTKAVDVLTEKVALGLPLGAPALLHHGPFEHKNLNSHPEPNRLYDSGSFKDFTFKTPTELFIFLHHPEITLQSNALIGFKGGYADNGEMYDENNCFFHAREVPDAQMPGLAGKGKMIRVENHATNYLGQLQDPGDYTQYSLDIYFQIDGGSAGTITMVVDPDTGNGVGYEP